MKYRNGFTLIELLITITIIGLLTSVILGSLTSARDKAREGKTNTELRSLRSAVALLVSDTGKWPNGCPVGAVSNPEVELDTAQAGIKQQPTVQDNGDGCEWIASDISNWDGPYMETPVDPWGNSYWFDPDYRPGDNVDEATNCDGGTATIDDISVIVSFGPDGIGDNKYNCDDIFTEMK